MATVTAQRPRRTVRVRGSGLAVLAAACALVALAGCGSSSKPAYCSDVSNFKSAVQDLKNVNIQNGTSELTSAVNKVESTGKAAVSSAKGAYSSQTSAVQSSLTALGASVKQLANPQSAKAALAAIPGEISAVGSATDALASAVKSKC